MDEKSVAFDNWILSPPQRDALSSERKHAQRSGLSSVWNTIGLGSIGVEILFTRLIRRAFRLTCDDGLIRDGLVSIAGQGCQNVRAPTSNTQTRPAEMNFALNKELQTEIATITGFGPRTIARITETATAGVAEHGSHNSWTGGKSSLRSNRDSGLQGRGVMPGKLGESLYFVALMSGKNRQNPGVIEPNSTGEVHILETEIGSSIMVEIKRNGVIGRDVLVSRCIDDLCLGCLIEGQ